jgi:hypothetical protein
LWFCDITRTASRSSWTRLENGTSRSRLENQSLQPLEPLALWDINDNTPITIIVNRIIILIVMSSLSSHLHHHCPIPSRAPPNKADTNFTDAWYGVRILE